MNSLTDYHHTAPTRFIEIGGVSYAYRTFGNAAEVPLVCLQHFTGTLDNWDPLITNSLAKHRQLILIDNTGVGYSGGQTPDNVLDMAEDAAKVILALGIYRCDLLGFSLGGFIAQVLADLKPDLIRKLIIVGSAPQGVKALHRFPEMVANAMNLDPAERFLNIFFTRSVKSRAKGLKAFARLMERTEHRDQDTGSQAIGAQIEAISRWGTDPVTIDLGKIHQPVLIINGSNDAMMDSDSSIELFHQLPNAIVTLYPDAAHGAFYQYPETFTDQANSFLHNFN